MPRRRHAGKKASVQDLRLSLCRAALLAAVALATRAHASKPASDYLRELTEEVPTLRVTPGDGVTLGPAIVSVECHFFELGAMRCGYAATFEATSTKDHGGLRVAAIDPPAVSARNATAPQPLSVEPAPVPTARAGPPQAWSVTGFPAGQTVHVTIEGALIAWGDPFRTGFALRHPLFSGSPEAIHTRIGVAGFPGATLRLERHERWSYEIETNPAPDGDVPLVGITSLTCISPAYPAVGGFLAFGAADGRFMGRAGLELTYGGNWAAGLSVDTAFANTTTVAATFEAMTPSLVFPMPSLSIGVGVPLQVAPTVTPGVRMTSTLQFPLVGLVVAADLFPGAPAGEQQRFTIMGRLSL